MKMNWRTWYSWKLNLRAMYETIGNYHQREYAIANKHVGVARWLYVPEKYWSVSMNAQFPAIHPDKYYYSVANLDWKSAGCYYKIWRPNFVDSRCREAIRLKCNANFDEMAFGFDCAIDIDSHDPSLSYQENAAEASILAEKVAEYIDDIQVPYILCYSGRGFSFRIPWDKQLDKVGDRFDVFWLMSDWVESLKELTKSGTHAEIDNIMNQEKRYTKVPYSLIVYPDMITYAKRITSDELDGFEVPEPRLLHGEHRDFDNAGNYDQFIEELNELKKS